jgi:dolichol-phosphate mannosyltransferase
MRVWVFLPTYNEESSIPKLFPKLRAIFEENGLDYRLVVVEDGSTDSTAALLDSLKSSYPLDVVRHEINRGLGETERDGFEYVAANASDVDVMVRLDCDDTHEPSYILDMLAKLNEGNDVVNTSRFARGGGQKGLDGYRTIISLGANLFMKLFFELPGVRDASCGFRAYRVRVIKDALRVYGSGFIQLKGLGFTSTLEIIVKLSLLGCRFAEVPFVLRYDQKRSQSKMIGSVTTLGYVVMVILYHWPWGGWRRFYKRLATCYRDSPEKAVSEYCRHSLKRSSVCQIGG